MAEIPKYFYFRVHVVKHGTALEIENASDIDVEEVIRCKDCIFQRKTWHEDKRYLPGGYWIYSCSENEDPFVNHVVDGFDDDYCSQAIRREV